MSLYGPFTYCSTGCLVCLHCEIASYFKVQSRISIFP
uniref:Uncharacterized protein n=1 Tax=Arundo donax TaxID=35708 RepID=A0A0A9FT04_ARUDO